MSPTSDEGLSERVSTSIEEYMSETSSNSANSALVQVVVEQSTQIILTLSSEVNLETDVEDVIADASYTLCEETEDCKVDVIFPSSRRALHIQDGEA